MAVGIGQAQMALGLLNATIDQISKYIFIGTEIFETISGRPRYDLSNVLHLDLANIRTNSFMVSKRNIDSLTKCKFILELGKNGVFNFVFNFSDIGSFKMLRLDNRKMDKTRNALLYCKQPFYWDFEADAEVKHPPSGEIQVEIEIDKKTNIFLLRVNGKNYKFLKGDKEISLINELNPKLRIGWFNEVAPVKLTNLKMD